MNRTSEPAIEDLKVAAYTIPTASPEADGTLEWDRTTIVVVQATSEGVCGIGYSYSDISAAQLIDCTLRPLALQESALGVNAVWKKMTQAIRNLGRPGICSAAIAAVDTALWDLKARLLRAPLAMLAGGTCKEIPAYGSGGFTSYTIEQLQTQLSQWASEGIRAVKMKVGACPEADESRVRAARKVIGGEVELFVDANGAYARKQALEMAARFRDFGVSWFEEPVPSDDLEGLRLIRDRAPAGMEIAAGEYGYTTQYFRQMLEAGAVDVLQADATRCAGATGFLQADALCHSFGLPLSAHTAPSLHAHLCCAALQARHVEYFYDHVRIERMFFDGAAEARGGFLRPNFNCPGNGLSIKFPDIEKYHVYGHLAARGPD